MSAIQAARTAQQDRLPRSRSPLQMRLESCLNAVSNNESEVMATAPPAVQLACSALIGVTVRDLLSSLQASGSTVPDFTRSGLERSRRWDDLPRQACTSRSSEFEPSLVGSNSPGRQIRPAWIDDTSGVALVLGRAEAHRSNIAEGARGPP